MNFVDLTREEKPEESVQCKLCDIRFQSRKLYQIHVTGMLHMRRVTAQSQADPPGKKSSEQKMKSPGKRLEHTSPRRGKASLGSELARLRDGYFEGSRETRGRQAPLGQHQDSQQKQQHQKMGRQNERKEDWYSQHPREQYQPSPSQGKNKRMRRKSKSQGQQPSEVSSLSLLPGDSSIPRLMDIALSDRLAEPGVVTSGQVSPQLPPYSQHAASTSVSHGAPAEQQPHAGRQVTEQGKENQSSSSWHQKVDTREALDLLSQLNTSYESIQGVGKASTPKPVTRNDDHGIVFIAGTRSSSTAKPKRPASQHQCSSQAGRATGGQAVKDTPERKKTLQLQTVQDSEIEKNLCKLCNMLVRRDLEEIWGRHCEGFPHRKAFLYQMSVLGPDKFVQRYGDVHFGDSRDYAKDVAECKDAYSQFAVRCGILNNFMCRVCWLNSNGPGPWMLHILSKKHTEETQNIIKKTSEKEYLQSYSDVPSSAHENMLQNAKPFPVYTWYLDRLIQVKNLSDSRYVLQPETGEIARDNGMPAFLSLPNASKRKKKQKAGTPNLGPEDMQSPPSKVAKMEFPAKEEQPKESMEYLLEAAKNIVTGKILQKMPHNKRSQHDEEQQLQRQLQEQIKLQQQLQAQQHEHQMLQKSLEEHQRRQQLIHLQQQKELEQQLKEQEHHEQLLLRQLEENQCQRNREKLQWHLESQQERRRLAAEQKRLEEQLKIQKEQQQQLQEALKANLQVRQREQLQQQALQAQEHEYKLQQQQLQQKLIEQECGLREQQALIQQQQSQQEKQQQEQQKMADMNSEALQQQVQSNVQMQQVLASNQQVMHQMGEQIAVLMKTIEKLETEKAEALKEARAETQEGGKQHTVSADTPSALEVHYVEESWLPRSTNQDIQRSDSREKAFISRRHINSDERRHENFDARPVNKSTDDLGRQRYDLVHRQDETPERRCFDMDDERSTNSRGRQSIDHKTRYHDFDRNCDSGQSREDAGMEASHRGDWAPPQQGYHSASQSWPMDANQLYHATSSDNRSVPTNCHWEQEEDGGLLQLKSRLNSMLESTRAQHSHEAEISHSGIQAFLDQAQHLTGIQDTNMILLALEMVSNLDPSVVEVLSVLEPARLSLVMNDQDPTSIEQLVQGLDPKTLAMLGKVNVSSIYEVVSQLDPQVLETMGSMMHNPQVLATLQTAVNEEDMKADNRAQGQPHSTGRCRKRERDRPRQKYREQCRGRQSKRDLYEDGDRVRQVPEDRKRSINKRKNLHRDSQRWAYDRHEQRTRYGERGVNRGRNHYKEGDLYMEQNVEQKQHWDRDDYGLHGDYEEGDLYMEQNAEQNQHWDREDYGLHMDREAHRERDSYRAVSLDRDEEDESCRGRDAYESTYGDQAQYQKVCEDAPWEGDPYAAYTRQRVCERDRYRDNDHGRPGIY